MKRGYLRAAELTQLGLPFDAVRALELGLVRSLPTESLATATRRRKVWRKASAPGAAGLQEINECLSATSCAAATLRTRSSPRECARPKQGTSTALL